MLKVMKLALGVILIAFVAELSCQKFIQPTYRPHVQRPRIILPTYRPPTRGKITRYVREASDLTPVLKDDTIDHTLSRDQDLLLNRPERSLDSPSAKRGGGHSTPSGSRNTGPTHPGYNRRNARSVDSPSAKRGGGGPRASSGSRNTGPTHPGYNRRNAREIRLPGHLNPLRPKPLYPRPTFPAPVPRIPILARTARDIKISGLPKKPTHRDVIIPNWNPNARTNPWNRIGGRHRRSLDFIEDGEESVAHERQTRDIQISGLPKKPTHRDVIIPNWNPNARTNPWNRIGGRHQRSLDFIEDGFESLAHERQTRDIQISGLPKKPTHRDVIIPNWNPNARTNPWNRIGGRQGRSIDFIKELVTDKPHERKARGLWEDARRHEISSLLKKPRHPEGTLKSNKGRS